MSKQNEEEKRSAFTSDTAKLRSIMARSSSSWLHAGQQYAREDILHRYPINPITELPTDPITGFPVDPMTGLPLLRGGLTTTPWGSPLPPIGPDGRPRYGT